jgi:poly(hydroxyalkanoate) granule-associated protein
MVKKLQKLSNDKKKTGAQLSSTVKDSAQQIWLAGLGAFSKAQEEGGKVFEALVKEGLSLQRKTQASAEEKISETTSRMADMANGISSRAAGQWDKLETIFEDRVAKALGRLGIPAAADLAALNDRIEALETLLGKPAKAADDAAAKPAARKRPAAKVAAAAEEAAAPEAEAPVKPARRSTRKAAPVAVEATEASA